jgi:hypothetical protein
VDILGPLALGNIDDDPFEFTSRGVTFDMGVFVYQRISPTLVS